jgi:ParB family transcriptional regulator, chromosome partitioning protein
MSFETLMQKANQEQPKERSQMKIGIIAFDPEQPRKTFNQEDIKTLAKSMEARGQRQAIGVRQDEEGTYILVFGERRLEAAKYLGWTHIDVVVQDNVDDHKTRLIVQLEENIKRQNLSQLEKGLAGLEYLKLEFGADEQTVNEKLNKALAQKSEPDDQAIIEELLKILECSLKTFYNQWLALSKIDLELLSLIKNRQLDESKALLLNRVKDLDVRQALLERCKTQNLSVADLSKAINQHKPKEPSQIDKEQKVLLQGIRQPASAISRLNQKERTRAWELIRELSQLLKG